MIGIRRIIVLAAVVGLVTGACKGDHNLEATTRTTSRGRFPAAVVSPTTASTTPSGDLALPTTSTTRKPTTGTTTAPATTTTTAAPARTKPAETPLPIARAGVAGTAWQGLIVVAGGLGSGGGYSVRVDAYDPKTGEWTRGPNLPVAVRDAALGVLGDDLWLVGGTAIENGQPVAQSQTYFFHPNDDTWQNGPALHTARTGVATATLGNFLVAVGGEQSDGTILDSVEVIASGRTEWKVAPSLTIPRAFASALAMNGRIYAVGGRTPGAPAVNSVESWRSGGGWRAESRLDKERVGLAGAGACVAGGQNSGGVVSSVECFGSGFWVTQAQMRVPRFGLAAVVIDGWLHLIGGSTNQTAVTDVHEVVDVSHVET